MNTEKAASDLTAETKNGQAVYRHLNLSSLASVREFAEAVKSGDLPPLYGLVCNAGLSYSSDEVPYTEEGFEMTFGVNHLAHFLLANLLVDEMEDNGRIVFVSSDTHDPAQKTGMPAMEESLYYLMAYIDENKNMCKAIFDFGYKNPLSELWLDEIKELVEKTAVCMDKRSGQEKKTGH